MPETQVKTLVVAVDGSEPSWEAMNTALDLAKLLHRPVAAVHIVQMVKAGYFGFIDRHLKEEQEVYAKTVLKEAVERGKKKGVEVTPHLVQSPKSPAEAILDFLQEAGPVKFLVMGAHGHGFVARHLLGSVTERVMREVANRGLAVPVLVVPPMAVED